MDTLAVRSSVSIRPQVRFACLMPFRSIGAIMSHVTYLLPILSTITGKNGTIQRVRDFGRENVLKRLATGARRKDLFHHLVRQHTEPTRLPH